MFRQTMLTLTALGTMLVGSFVVTSAVDAQPFRRGWYQPQYYNYYAPPAYSYYSQPYGYYARPYSRWYGPPTSYYYYEPYGITPYYTARPSVQLYYR